MTYWKLGRGLCLVVLAAFGIVLATAAEAQIARFISTTGNDGNECTFALPCRTLQRGINRVTAGGEVQILDSGTYGEVINITKSVNVTADGVMATVGRIMINAPDDTVALRGLHVSGRNVTITFVGISVAAAAEVFITDCDIEGVPNPGSGVQISSADTKIAILRTTIRDHGAYGIIVGNTSSNIRLVVEDTRIANNHNDGIRHLGPSGEVSVERSFFIGNGNAGFLVGNGAIGRISNSVVINNATGLQNDASTLQTRSNNLVRGNTSNVTGALTPVSGT